jgi:hypothetical protein
MTYTREQINELSTLESEVESQKARAEAAEARSKHADARATEMALVKDALAARASALEAALEALYREAELAGEDPETILASIRAMARVALRGEESPAACGSATVPEDRPQTGSGSGGTVAPRSEGSGRSACDERCTGTCQHPSLVHTVGPPRPEWLCPGWRCDGLGPAHRGGGR